MPGLEKEDWVASWRAWLQGCQGLKNKADWKAVCAAALMVKTEDVAAIQAYWQQYFNVYATQQPEGAEQGLITGYYQPVLQGARQASARYRVPLYQVPTDLITVNLSGLFPELKYKRVRGRVQGQTLVPYYTRAEIEQPQSPLNGSELLWVSDPVEAFFLQVQGSGIVMLENGERVPVGYADQNGHPYQSIGKILVERGEMAASEASMQGIKTWAQQHPDQLRGLLDANPSYVFFKLLPPGLSGPLGALGVPLTAARSVAVDPFYIPLGAPVYLATTYPNDTIPLQQLMQAQDTGGAIKGGVRADVYWGEGEAAGKLAGAMRQQGKLWVWLPKTFPLPH
jgi:membrane-bound lytic murein transglycosylase A